MLKMLKIANLLRIKVFFFLYPIESIKNSLDRRKALQNIEIYLTKKF